MTLIDFKNSLKRFLTVDQILDSDVDLRLYDTDATSLFKNKASLVLIPNTSTEVQLIIQCIVRHNLELEGSQRLNFVARGAGTGLSGGAIASKNSIIISLAKLNKLISFDPINQTALIETGLVNSQLSKITRKHNLYFSPDPSSQEACTIGGNIAENAGGIHCYKYGVTSEQILGLEIICPDASIRYLGQLNDDLLQSPLQSGIDLAKFFVGSEGTFGIATKALVKLKQIPESFITIRICFSSIDAAAQTVSAIIREGFVPSALEMIDHGAIQAVKAAFNLNLDEAVKAILLIELDGDNDEILVEAQAIKNLVCSKYNPIQYEETQDAEQKNFLWQVRKSTVAAFGQIAPFWYLYDAVVPRSQIPHALAVIEQISTKYDLKLATVMHAADGNLHPNFLYDPEKDSTVVERIHLASKEIMKLCIDLGGALSGEHGIGVEKQDFMPYMFSDEDLNIMLAIRKIFDPQMISNPAKIFPMRICRE
jgi:glycolate oxidase subunit GlcD